MAKRKALGRGLNALIPDAPTPNQDKNTIEYIDPEKISPNPFQPRENFDRVKLDELRDSISENGIVDYLFLPYPSLCSLCPVPNS